MDKFVIRSKPGSDSHLLKKKGVDQLKKQVNRPLQTHRKKSSISSNLPQVGFISSSVSKINRKIDSTLKDPSNPITHNDGYKRAQHIVSSSTGHQQSNGSSASSSSKWQEIRNKKLQEQAQRADSKILKNVIAYINGYTGHQVTNQQLISMITSAGGEVRRMQSGRCTHIITSMELSGSKTQKEVMRKKSGIPIVKPEWVIDSLRLGKRQAEWKYSVSEHDTQKKISLVFGQINDQCHQVT
ncbi:BRCT domain-containing protein [Melampsora americana]|nr:BRCT domain-containing protein [Melampsora americana]